MTISSTNRKAGPFIGNGSASVFAFSFRVFAASDLEVVRITVATGVETTLTINSAYTVSLNADQNSNPGGSITLTGGALASGYNLIITSAIANLQPTDLTNQGGFYPEVITDALDRATIQIQQLDEHVNRNLAYPITDPSTGFELPAAAQRKGNTLAFDPTTGAPISGPSISAVGSVSSNISNVNTVAANIADVNVVADNIDAVAGAKSLSLVYQGPKSTNPTLRNDGTAIQTGDLYFNTTNDRMRVYETGTGWIDYEATAQTAATTATTQAGTATTQASVATTQAAIATTQASTAVTARTAAETARDAAFGNADVYASTAAGLAAVADGVQFQVVSGTEIIRYVRTNSTTATEVARYPRASTVNEIQSDLLNTQFDLSELRRPFANYNGSAVVVPLVTDAEGALIIGVDQRNGDVQAAGLLGKTESREMGMRAYIGSGPVYPIVTDAQYNVLLGYNSETNALVGATDVTVRLVEDPLPTPIVKKAYNHLLFYGQSLSIGANSGPVISTSQPYSNVTFNGGPRAWNGTTWDFGAFKALVEDAVSPAPDGGTDRRETPCSGAANFASTLMAQRGVQPSSHVVLASTAGRGGYRINQLNKGTSWYLNLIAHVNGARALNTDYAVHAVCWLQGENDVNVTNYSTYRASLAALQDDTEADIKAITGQTSPVYMITYQVSFGAAVSKDVALAQLDLAQNDDKIFFASPTYRFPPAADGVHLTAIGYKLLGAYFGRAYEAISRGKKPQWLNPKSATIRGSQIRIRFDVPQQPLTLDQLNLAVTTNNGFKVLDGVSTASISSMSTSGSDVVINLSSVPSGTVTVRYGLDYLGSGLAITDGASGNLRDSTSDTMVISGTTFTLWHVSPAFELTAIKIGE